MPTSKLNWDALGITASIACAIHCAVLPLAISSLPILGVNIIHNEAFEYGMIFLAFSIGSYSLFHGYKMHHRLYAPFILFAVGMAILLAKMRWHDQELWLLPFAVIFIVSAHVLNIKRSRGNQTKKGEFHRNPELG